LQGSARPSEHPERGIVLALIDVSEAKEVNLTPRVTVEPMARTALERAAPIYRKTSWPAHCASSDAFRAALQELVDRHGRAVLQFITLAYGEPWPAAGFPVRLSAYVDLRGAYSTSGNLLVVSATRDPSEQGTIPLEIVFHEAMHQWDDLQEPAWVSHDHRKD
jgi:hypothetical protein